MNGRHPRRGSMPHHQTVDLNVHGDTVPINRNIAPLVAALNKLHGVHTLESCEAFPLDGRTWVWFEIAADTANAPAPDSHVSKVLRQLSITCQRAGIEDAASPSSLAVISR
jgi:hypothetical protein